MAMPRDARGGADRTKNRERAARACIVVPMPIDAEAVLAHLDVAAGHDWPTFRGISAFEPHAMRLVVLRERGTDDWGLIFETICGEILAPELPIGIGVATKIYGPSVPLHAVNVPVRRAVAITTTDHDPRSLSVDGVVVTGPRGPLRIDNDLLARLDVRPGRVANLDGLTESPAEVLLVRAYLAAYPGSLFPPLPDTVAALGGRVEDVFLVTDAFEHVLGPDAEGEPPPLDRFAILPSQSPSYRSLARALAADDPTLFVPGDSNLDHRLWATEPDANAT